jgi:hypothetical protein
MRSEFGRFHGGSAHMRVNHAQYAGPARCMYAGEPMNNHKRVAHIAVTLGLVSGGLIASTGVAVAATPRCETSVVGVLPSGRLVDRWVKNTGLKKNHVSTDPLPFSVTNMVWTGFEKITGGGKYHVNAFGAGTRPRNLDVTRLDASTDLTVNVTKTYQRSFRPRLVAGSGRYYVYAVNKSGNLKRWTRRHDSAGNLWFDTPKLVARNMGGLKTLSYSWTYKIDGGWKDVLYGTTRGGALKQIRIPWRRPANDKVTTIKKTGFASYTGLSLSFCNNNTNYLSIVAIDRTHNRARWFTMPRALTPCAANLVRRGLVAQGSNWRLHATF